MIGAIIGDIVGSRFEFENTDTKKFELFTDECTFTDDTVMTLAVAESMMQCYDLHQNYDALSDYAVAYYHVVGRRHPNCGYGGKFYRWMMGDLWIPYNSYGNGSAMRISPVGDVALSTSQAKDLSHKLTCVTHNHPEGLKGAEAAAVAKVLLRDGNSMSKVRNYINDRYYKLDKTVKDYRKEAIGHGQEICQVTMPQAFTCLFEGKNFEDVIRNCISIGGDSDTIAAIAGGIAEACYEVPEWMKEKAKSYLTNDLLDVLERWEAEVLL